MKSTAIIVTLVCCGLMFFVRRETKAALLVMGAMTLTLVNIPGVPLEKANYMLQAAFLLSELGSLSRHLKALRHTRFLWKVLLLVSFSAVLAALTSHYVKLGRFLQSEILFKYFAIAYAFWAVKDERSLKPILRVSLYCLLVLTFFGVLNYINRSAMFVNALTEGRESLFNKGVSLGNVYSGYDRFRVQSMSRHPFDYGYICAAMLILHMHGRNRRLESQRAFVTALVCCLFGIVMCGCRIVWAGTLLSIVCYLMWAFRLNRAVVYGMTAMIIMIMSYYTIPAVEERVNMLTDIFVEDSETAGSSIEMRMAQYMEVLYRTEGHEWLGLGKGYWGYIYSEDQNSVGNLLGIESVILSYLLERGIIGLVLWAIFYTVIFRYFWKNRKKNKALTGLGGAILTLYLVFSIGTGELGSVYPTMLLLGFVIKGIEKCDHRGWMRRVGAKHIDVPIYQQRRHTPQSLRDSSPNIGEQQTDAQQSNISMCQHVNILTHQQSPMKRLAIIIPAYKATFLPAALDSITAQTSKDFTLYVGDDCSPEPIGEIVEQYRDKIELVYQRFDTNLGGKDLVAQWERCIAMSQEEPYIWLFSDDDVMESNCVEEFLKTVDATQRIYDLYHFDVKEINEEGTVTRTLPEYPQVLSAYDYYKGKNTGRYRSYVVENVFSRKIFEQAGGFKNFDLAWGSDVATWCIFCGNKGMYKIPEAHVLWRRSSQNITPDKSRQTAERKLMAECDFMEWAYAYFQEKSDILPVNEALFISKMMQYRRRVGWQCYQTAFATFYRVHGLRKNKLLLWLFLNLTPMKLYHLLKKSK